MILHTYLYIYTYLLHPIYILLYIYHLFANSHSIYKMDSIFSLFLMYIYEYIIKFLFKCVVCVTLIIYILDIILKTIIEIECIK